MPPLSLDAVVFRCVPGERSEYLCNLHKSTDVSFFIRKVAQTALVKYNRRLYLLMELIPTRVSTMLLWGPL